MSPLRRFLTGLALLASAMAAAAQSNAPVAATARVPIRMAGTNGLAAAAKVQSPVDFFRKLLQAPANERTRLLAGRSLMARNRILDKVREYEALDPEERESRLQATELRWYLVPLMGLARADRTNQLAQVPADLLPLVQVRLTQWDILPPPLQNRYLTNESALRYIAQNPRSSPPNPRAEQLAEQFADFFKVRPDEKQRVLNTLSEPERAQMEKTLKAFDQLPAAQRAICVRNYAKFVGMSEAERAEFLRSADNWSKMSAEERQTWRDLVSRVPIWPPLPPQSPIVPPLPPLPPSAANGRVATN